MPCTHACQVLTCLRHGSRELDRMQLNAVQFTRGSNCQHCIVYDVGVLPMTMTEIDLLWCTFEAM